MGRRLSQVKRARGFASAQRWVFRQCRSPANHDAAGPRERVPSSRWCAVSLLRRFQQALGLFIGRGELECLLQLEPGLGVLAALSEELAQVAVAYGEIGFA